MESTLTSRLSTCFLAAVAALAGCGGAQEAKPAAPAPAPAPESEDQAIELAPVELKGNQFQPEALGRPGMLFVEGKKKTTVDKQRAALKKAKPEQKETEAQILATLAYQAGKSEADQGKAQALLDDARSALRDARNTSKGQTQLVTLRMLGTLELTFGDYAAASEVYQEIVTRFPEGDHITAARTWLAFALLRQGKSAEALAAVQGLSPAPEQPELSYVIAWAKWRAGDGPGAAAAIAIAARGWKAPGFKKQIDRDTALILARSGAPVEEAIKVVVDANQNKRDETYKGLYDLHRAFAIAGRFADAIVILDKAAERVGEKVPVQDLASFRVQQADYALRASGDPAKVATYQEQALQVFKKCGDKCTKGEHESGATPTRNYATFFDTIYRTARDERFYAPAQKLYELYLALPDRADAAETQKFFEDMKTAKEAADDHSGKHDKGFIGTLVEIRGAQVLTCYEAALAADPATSGPLALNLEVAATGEVKGVATEPAAGQAGMAGVAGCVAERAKGWTFPSRTKPGVTRIAVKYVLGPASAASAPEAPAPAAPPSK